jgi:hypothetical protein
MASPGLPVRVPARVGALTRMALANIVSNQPASPITLAKRIAACPKARRNRNGFIRIGIWPPKLSNHHQLPAPCATEFNRAEALTVPNVPSNCFTRRLLSLAGYAIRALPDLCFGIVSGRLGTLIPRCLFMDISLESPGLSPRGFLSLFVYRRVPNQAASAALVGWS